MHSIISHEQTIIPCLLITLKLYIIMNNASIHKMEEVWPIFSSSPTNEDQLVHNIHVAMEEISQENCRQYYDKMESNILKIYWLDIVQWTIFE